MASRATVSRATIVAAATAMSFAVPAVEAAPVQASQVIHLDDYRSFRHASAWNVLHRKLAAWSLLGADWDGEDAVSPSADVIAAAADFVDMLEACGAPVPSATIAGDGEVAFEWAKGDGFASVSYTDDGSVIAFLREDDLTPALRIDSTAQIEVLAPFMERIGAFA